MPRLIDAEPLRAKLTWLNEYDYLHVLNDIKSMPRVNIDSLIAEHEDIGYEKGRRDGYAEAVTDIERHGHWINHFDDLFPEESTQECSVCHAEQMGTMLNDNYCPNCGARMDEVKEDAETN